MSGHRTAVSSGALAGTAGRLFSFRCSCGYGQGSYASSSFAATAARDHAYAFSAAEGMLVSLTHYGNSNPAVGDGRVGTPAWYANRLGKVLYMRKETMPGNDTMWWGTRYRLYAQQILGIDPEVNTAAV